MSEAASRELRNNTRALLDRVEAGEEITITLSGRPVAVLKPLARRARWLTREEFVRTVTTHQTDPGLTAELCDLTGETSEDLPIPKV